jgi:hypothetical protein
VHPFQVLAGYMGVDLGGGNVHEAVKSANGHQMTRPAPGAQPLPPQPDQMPQDHGGIGQIPLLPQIVEKSPKVPKR